MDIGDNDDYDQLFNDPTLVAALERSERSHPATPASESNLRTVNSASSTSTPNRTTTTLGTLASRRNNPQAASTASPPTISTAQPQKQVPIKQPVPTKVGRGGTSSIIVSTKQRGNPVLNHIRNVPWEYGEIVPDYLVGESACALFLSLKYHKLHPDYIYTRIKALGNAYKLRILLILVDINEHADPLRELMKVSVVSNVTNIVAWSSPEVGRYLETYKAYEHTPPTLIMEKRSDDYATRVTEVFTQVRSVNKTDAMNLISNFGSVRAAINAHPEEIMMIPGWGQQKVTRFLKAMHEPFIVNRSKRPTMTESSPPPSATADPAVAARLGIEPYVQAESPALAVEWNINADEEEALAAAHDAEVMRTVAPAQTHTRTQATTATPIASTPTSSAVQLASSVLPEGSPRPASAPSNAILDALAKMREE